MSYRIRTRDIPDSILTRYTLQKYASRWFLFFPLGGSWVNISVTNKTGLVEKWKKDYGIDDYLPWGEDDL